MKIRRYEIDICDGCIDLQGEMCHTPGCIFIRQTTEEIKEFLDRTAILPFIDGVPLWDAQIAKECATFAYEEEGVWQDNGALP